jgi:solute carrier family 8 (sodium/calcium exchanger)
VVKCCGDDNTTESYIVGTFLTVTQHCSTCSFTFKWDSQPVVKNIPEENSAAILFSGALPARMLRLFKLFGCASISSSTYFSHQKRFLQPSVFTVWNQHQADLFKQLRHEKRPLIIGGDGRADSPGHSAKFGSYTVMELKKKVVIDIQLVQVSKTYIYNNVFRHHACICRVMR